MKNRNIILTLLFLSLSLHGQSYRVLYISSYHPGFPTYHRQLDGIQSALPLDQVILDEEFMDTKRLGWEENKESFHRRLEFKLQHTESYDLVITADDNALQFMQEYGPVLFPSTPFVFLGINDISNGLNEKRNTLSTGILEEVSFTKTFDLILHQFPKADEIVVISDGTTSGKADLNSFMQIVDKNSPLNIRVLNLEKYTFLEMESLLETYKSGVPLLLLSAYVDSTGETLSFFKGFDRIYLHARGPIYHLWEHGFGKGALGGHVVDHNVQGKKAGEMAWRILQGESPSTIQIIIESPNSYLFDYNEIKKWKISKKLIPDDSYIMNSQRENQEHLRKLILMLLFFIIILTLVVMTFVHFNRKLKSVNKDLLESRNRFEYLFQNNPVNLLLINPINGRIKEANSTALEFYGYNLEEIQTLNIYQINQSTQQEINREMKKAEREKRKYFIFRHKLKDGTIKDVEVFSGSIQLNGTTFLLSAIYDITEKAYLHRELVQKEKMNALGFLAGGIAHDFNNLLTGIIGYADLLKRGDIEEELKDESIDMILQSAIKSKDLTQSILIYSRNKEKKKEKFSLVKTVEECLAEQEIIIPDTIEVIREFSGMGIILANGAEIHRVIQNLVTNAIQAMENCQGQLTLRVSPYFVNTTNHNILNGLAFGSYQLMEVEDQGIGISEEVKKYLFDPYYSTKKLGLGTGLGLAMVRSIVEEEEGIIQVESTINKGTIFKVYLPSIE